MYFSQLHLSFDNGVFGIPCSSKQL